MQITPSFSNKNSCSFREEELISSLKSQPIIIIIRIHENKLSEYNLKATFSLISNLINEGVKNIEIAWSENQNWEQVAKEIILEFKGISFGAASITNNLALKLITKIGFSYAMSPVLEKSMVQEAQAIGQLLIPGVFSPSEFQQALTLNCKIIKLFPASTLGINYLNQLKAPLKSLPVVIAAGGLNVQDLDPWLAAGYSAITLGRGLEQNERIDPLLQKWLTKNKLLNQVQAKLKRGTS